VSTAARRTELLMAAAATLDDGGIPLMDPFLSAHGVTLDECFDLAEQLAIGARVVAWGLAHPQSDEARAVLLAVARSA
jgi:hypothetical protein